jgi:hypothetical protein
MSLKINPIDCYSEFSEQSSVVSDFCKRMLLTKKINWGVEDFGWDLIPVPVNLTLKEPLLQKINSVFPIAKSAILKSQPYQNYGWHTDRVRGVSINLLISTDIHSHCMFGTLRDQSSLYFTELKYKENTFYLFNTQCLHQVINFSEPRYLLTIEFVQDKNSLQYSNIYNWCTAENLLR